MLHGGINIRPSPVTWFATLSQTAGMPQPTISRHWNWWACIAYAVMLAALVFYFYVRIRWDPFRV